MSVPALAVVVPTFDNVKVLSKCLEVRAAVNFALPHRRPAMLPGPAMVHS